MNATDIHEKAEIFMTYSKASRIKGFTLIELLVVIAIIALLAAILFPVFGSARAKSRQSTCQSNLKQLGIAMNMYTQDFDENFMSYGVNSLGAEISWGKYYWPFQLKPYITGFPTNFDKPRSNIFVCPSDPGQKPQYLSDDRATQVLPEPATSWGLSETTDPEGDVALAYWCSYSINEHMTDRETSKGKPNLAAWADPSRTYMLLEARDSEIEGDELDELLFEHSTGTNILYMDGHVKWLKAVYKNNDPTDKTNWISPPYDPGGNNGTGPWTAPDTD